MVLSNLGRKSSKAEAHSPGRPRILIVRAGAIGDTLMATPLVRAVRQTYPECRLVFLCSAAAHDVLRYNPHIDQIIPIAYRHLPTWLSSEKSRIHRTLRGLDPAGAPGALPAWTGRPHGGPQTPPGVTASPPAARSRPPRRRP